MAPFVGFIGKHNLRIDDKNRLTMPSRFKSVLSEQYPDDDDQVVVRLSLDMTLTVEPLSEYAKVAEEYERYNDLDEEARQLKEMITGLATIEKVSGGRIRLSSDLREIAGLEGRDVTLVGRNRSFAIWDREKWEERQAATLRDLKHLTKQVREKNKRD